MNANRQKVYQLIDEERDYQDSKPPRPKTDAETSVAEWLNYMRFHLNLADEAVYHLDEKKALECIRKATALGVACMEFNHTPSRKAG